MTDDIARIAALELQVAALRKALEDAICAYVDECYECEDVDTVRVERWNEALSLPAPEPSSDD